MHPHDNSGLTFAPPHDGKNKVPAEHNTKDHQHDLLEIHKTVNFFPNRPQLPAMKSAGINPSNIAPNSRSSSVR